MSDTVAVQANFTVPTQANPAPKTPVSLAAGVNAAVAAKVTLPPGLVSKSTKDIVSPWMRAIIYGETGSRRTTTAAHYGNPDQVRIISTRDEDQLIPLRNDGYTFVYADTVSKIRFSMLYPENIWPDWAKRDDRILIVDDISKTKNLIVDDNSETETGKERNLMQTHRDALNDMGELTGSLFRKPMHLIFVAGANIYENKITHEETCRPDLPPAMNRMLTTDFTFVLYVDKKKHMFLTDDYRETYEDLDEKMQKKTFTRVYFAKHKLPHELEGKGVLNLWEPMDLQKIWNKVKTGSAK